MNWNRLIPHPLFPLMVFSILACAQLVAQKPPKSPAAAATGDIDAEKIRAHVKFLASDLLEGRGTGQRGGDIAAEYIAAQFELYGLKPAAENGSYFQDVPMMGVKALESTSFKLVPANGETVALKNLDDFVTNNESQTETADIDAPIVFVGYGITAPEYNWDDYKGVDLKGKVALLFVNEPTSDDPKFFKGKALTYYGRWTYKFEETARHGAVATLIIHRTDLASYGWQVVRNSWGTEKSHLRRDATPKLQAASWIQLDVANKIAAMSGQEIDHMFQQAQSRDFKPIELPVRLQAHVASQLHPFVGKQGLLGSEYLGKHSPVPPGKIALDLNYDALPPIGDPEETEVSGAERTTFYPVVESTAKEFGLVIRPDSRPEAGHYYRSDHFSLARVGVPAFSINEGLKYQGHDAAWGESQAQDYVDHRYHQPSDEYRPEMNFAGLAKMARFGFALGQKAASQPAMPGWQPGDEFEAARKRSEAGN